MSDLRRKEYDMPLPAQWQNRHFLACTLARAHPE